MKVCLIRQALHHSGDNEAEAARPLGITPGLLTEKMRQLGTAGD